ncbi:MAG: hybrid sensor histidine kinase/response regulator, partial [Clostridia bacterium]
TQLVHGLLDVARVNQGTIEITRAPVALRDIVEHALDITQPRMYHSGITLHVTAPQEPVFVDGDRVRLAQILANLIDNAYKFTEPGGEVSILAETADGWLSLAVRDTGVGIPADGLSAVFDMFWRGQSAGSGLGLGLTLVRHLVELHGGRVEAFSPGPGQGSTFVLHLPLLQAEPAAREPRMAPGPVGGHRVLVVDDNADLVDVLSSLLRDLGATVTATRDGREVVTLARQFCPTVILLDIGMAPFDGYELARRIRADSSFDGVALVAITGWGGVEDVERMYASGFQHHVLKPVTLHELETLLAAIPTPGPEQLLPEG